MGRGGGVEKGQKRYEESKFLPLQNRLACPCAPQETAGLGVVTPALKRASMTGKWLRRGEGIWKRGIIIKGEKMEKVPSTNRFCCFGCFFPVVLKEERFFSGGGCGTNGGVSDCIVGWGRGEMGGVRVKKTSNGA